MSNPNFPTQAQNDARYATPASVNSAVAAQAATDAAQYSTLSVSQLFSGRRVGFGGDSITAGSGTTNATYSFINQSVRIAGSALIAVKVNGGVAGERSDQLLARVPTIIGQGIDHFHIQIGTNDASQSVSLNTYQTNIINIVKLCRAAGVSVSLGLVPPRGSSSGTTITSFVNLYNLWLRTWTAKQGIPLADTFTALVDATTGYLSSIYDIDGTHPNNAGHLAMAKVVAPVISARQLVSPWPVTAPSPIGLISNPLFNGTTGWTDQGGTATSFSATTLAPSIADGLPAGNWLAHTINNSANGSSVYRQITATLDSTKYSAGDTLAIYAYLSSSDATSTNASVKLQLTNNSTAFSIPLDTGGSVGNPGPMLVTVTVPANPGTIRLGIVTSAGPNTIGVGYLGCVQVYNITTGGLSGSF